jgi:hypothetical protein
MVHAVLLVQVYGSSGLELVVEPVRYCMVVEGNGKEAGHSLQGLVLLHKLAGASLVLEEVLQQGSLVLVPVPKDKEIHQLRATFALERNFI